MKTKIALDLNREFERFLHAHLADHSLIPEWIANLECILLESDFVKHDYSVGRYSSDFYAVEIPETLTKAGAAAKYLFRRIEFFDGFSGETIVMRLFSSTNANFKLIRDEIRQKKQDGDHD